MVASCGFHPESETLILGSDFTRMGETVRNKFKLQHDGTKYTLAQHPMTQRLLNAAMPQLLPPGESLSKMSEQRLIRHRIYITPLGPAEEAGGVIQVEPFR